MIAVIIPCFKVKNHILNVISQIGPEVKRIFIIDDACPENSGAFVNNILPDPRVEVVFHEVNKGVGGALVTGYQKALADKSIRVVVKLDGDGQMDAGLIPELVAPILKGKADYVKGNRFFDLGFLKNMPAKRLMGNSLLSFVNKMVSGYWNIMDPTNGFTAIHTDVLKIMPLSKLSSRYFFESDMLFRLSTIRAVVTDFPMHALYKDEKSNLSISKVAVEFPPKYLSRFFKRIFYNYFLRDFNVGTLELIFGVILFTFGLVFGAIKWLSSIYSGDIATSGTVMLAALPLILGFQLLLAFISFDVNNIPVKIIHRKRLKISKVKEAS